MVYEAYEVKTKGKITLSFTSPENVFFYFCDVITSPGKKKSAGTYYSYRSLTSGIYLYL